MSTEGRGMSVPQFLESMDALIDSINELKSSLPRTGGKVTDIFALQLAGIKNTVKHVKYMFFDFEQKVNIQLQSLQQQTRQFDNLDAVYGSRSLLSQVQEMIIPSIMRLKLEIFHHKETTAESSSSSSNSFPIVVKIPRNHVLDLVKELVKFDKFNSCPISRNFWSPYKIFEFPLHRRCLLCFSVFPENVAVSKTILMYWWRVIHVKYFHRLPKDGDDLDAIFMLFLSMGLIEYVIHKERTVGFKMHPFMRHVVIFRAESERLFSFDSNWSPSPEFANFTGAFLLERTREHVSSTEAPPSVSDLERLQTLFNVNDSCPNLEAKGLSKMKNLEYLSLGKWDKFKDSGAKEIIVSAKQVLSGLKNKKELMFLGLQGVSGITSLPSKINSMLPKLQVLDLKNCHSLKVLPKKIVLLERLTHLDVSGCSLLEDMPSGIGTLGKLEVLKGFILGNKNKAANSLADLAGLTSLEKLSIRISSGVTLPTKTEMLSLRQHLVKLRKLRITWEDDANKINGLGVQCQQLALGVDDDSFEPIKFPQRLKKLDIRNCPFTNLGEWVTTKTLNSINKLYIQGGNINNLDQSLCNDSNLNVKSLRLKNLKELSLAWEDVERAFPLLIYMEVVGCPKMTNFPCNNDGVWLNKKTVYLNDNQLLFDLGLLHHT